MPALRERREDIPLLANYFVAKASRKCNMRIKPLAPDTVLPDHYDWPGNVRELENALERALVLGSTDSILPDDLPEAILEAGSDGSSCDRQISRHHQRSEKTTGDAGASAGQRQLYRGRESAGDASQFVAAADSQSGFESGEGGDAGAGVKFGSQQSAV